MSRHENADVIRRGYEDQRDGKVDPVLAEEDSTRGVLYRTGMRELRREEQDQLLESGAGVIVERGVAGFGLHPDPARVVQTVDGLVAAQDVKEGQPVYVDDLAKAKRAAPVLPIATGPGGAFVEPVPGARKPRKAKPVDEGQGSLFG